MTKKASNEATKREKAENDVKQGLEVIAMLRRSLEARSMTVAEARREERREERRVEPSSTGSREDRRSRVRCWDLTRPGGCRYGDRCRYLHPVQVEEVEVSEQRQGFLHPLAMVREARGAMVGGEVASQQLLQKQMMSQQMRMGMRMTNQQYPGSWQNTMNQRMMSWPYMMGQQKMMMMAPPMSVYGHQGWPAMQ